MIFKNTFLKLADNTGPKTVKCLNIKNKSIGFLSDIVTVVLKKRFLKKKKIKKNILNSLIVNTKYKTKRKNGVFIKFNSNKSLLINHQLIFLGSNVKAIICKEIKKFKKKFKKIISYSPGNI